METGEFMSLLGLGIDLVSIQRVKKVYEKHPLRAPLRLLSKKERELLANQKDALRDAFLSGRFAAKEAILKVLGCGLGPDSPALSSIQILPGASGSPEISFLTPTKSPLTETNCRWFLSISHEKGCAIAVAAVEGL